MSKETNLRYEQPHRPSKLFQEYTKNLQSNDAHIINDLDQQMLDRQQLHDKWFERSNRKVKAKKFQTEQKQLKQELKMVAKANILVRKEALSKRLEADQKMYEEELAQMGKTFHKQRI